MHRAAASGPNKGLILGKELSMKKLIDSFLDSLDLSKTKVDKFPSKIFLCGGPPRESSERKGWASARHFIAEHLRINHPEISQHIVLAEVHADWRSGRHYKTLLGVEIDIVNLASAIIIFLESAGSIAELGAFSMLDNVKHRIHVFLQDAHSTNHSFINDGIIAHIDDAIPTTRVYTYDWKIEGELLADPDGFSEHITSIVDNIRNALAQESKPIPLDFKDSGHQMLFLVQMIIVFSALKITECYEIMSKVFQLSDDDVQSRVYALERLGMVKMAPYGGNVYYISLIEDDPCLLYSLKSQKLLDTDMYMISFRVKMKTLDDKRLFALKKIKFSTTESSSGL